LLKNNELYVKYENKWTGALFKNTTPVHLFLSRKIFKTYGGKLDVSEIERVIYAKRI